MGLAGAGLVGGAAMIVREAGLWDEKMEALP
jgi:hypothetical protein